METLLAKLQADCDERGNYTARVDPMMNHWRHAVEPSAHMTEFFGANEFRADIYCCHDCEIAGINLW